MTSAAHTEKDVSDQIKEFLSYEPTAAALGDLGTAVAKVLSEERTALTSDLVEKDLVPLLNRGKARLNSVKNAGVKTFQYLRSHNETATIGGCGALWSAVKQDTILGAKAAKGATIEAALALKEGLPEVRKRITDFTNKLAEDFKQLETPKDRGQYLLKISMYTAVFGIALKEGHDLPDLDFALWGPGAHRSFLSHSGLPLFVLSAAMIVLNRTLERSESHLVDKPDALALSQTIRTVAKLFTVGMGAGMAFHLAVDGVIQTGGTIRIDDLAGNTLGSIVPGTPIDDMAYTTVMALFTGETTDHLNKVA